MKSMKFVMVAMLLAMFGCKESDQLLTLLRSQEWELKSMTRDGEVVANPQQLPQLLFSDSTAVYGSAGCNRFFGTYETVKKGELTIKTSGATMMFCPDMAFEDQYLKALNEVQNYSVTSDELTLKSKDGKLVFVYVPASASELVGNAKDDHGCNAAAGYTWSEIRQDCIRLFEDGVAFTAVNGQDSTLAAYVVFAADSLKAEVFVPGQDVHPVLDRRSLPAGGYAWNQEDDDTFNVRIADGKWVIEQRGNVLYTVEK